MKKSYKFRSIITLLLFLLITLAGINATSLTQLPVQEQSPSQSKGTRHIVTRIIDGDTIIVDGEKTIRLIGIDTPEKNEYGYLEAKNALEKLINNRLVTVYTDQKILDPYNRTLAYIYNEEIFINLKMVELGWVRTMPIKPNLKHAGELKKAEDVAKMSKVGRWK